MKLYLDVCCLCRPFDDQTSYRVHMEAESVIAIINLCRSVHNLIGSDVIEYEIAQIADEERREAVESLLQCARDHISIDAQIVKRARRFHEKGIGTFDALHLASAESVDAVFLTTDDPLIAGIKTHEELINIKAYNPMQWLMEVTNGDEDTQ